MSRSFQGLAGTWDQSLFNRTSLPKQIADVWAPTSPSMTRFNPATKEFSPMTDTSSSTASFDEHRRSLNKRHQNSNITSNNHHANANSLPYHNYATKNTTQQHEQLSLPSRGKTNKKSQKRSRPTRQKLDFQEFHQQFSKRQQPHFQHQHQHQHQQPEFIQQPEFMHHHNVDTTQTMPPANYLFLPRFLPVLYA